MGEQWIQLSYHLYKHSDSWTRKRGQTTAAVSLDLGLSEREVTLEPERVVFPDGQALGWDEIAHIADDDTSCYAVELNTTRKIRQFSPRLNRFCNLTPTYGAPTILIAGFIMHRIKSIDPYADTMKKIQAATLHGQVLDTSTGLGYTAIEAAKRAAHVAAETGFTRFVRRPEAFGLIAYK